MAVEPLVAASRFARGLQPVDSYIYPEASIDMDVEDIIARIPSKRVRGVIRHRKLRRLGFAAEQSPGGFAGIMYMGLLILHCEEDHGAELPLDTGYSWDDLHQRLHSS